ncbi:MAG: helix-turn-helix transcriptional regulator [Ruminococcaceae bacterium]|nr:helix-turn-helix transcriptional regulator [Oscillospiraceae bacterium]
MNKPTVGQNIRRFRKEKNMTQSELAELLGVSIQAISKWETDAGMPDISQIVPLARVLEVSTDNLLGMEDAEQEAAFEELKSLIGRSVPHILRFVTLL